MTCESEVSEQADSDLREIFELKSPEIAFLPVSLLGPLIKQEMRSTAFGKICIKNKKCRTKSVAIRPHLFDI